MSRENKILEQTRKELCVKVTSLLRGMPCLTIEQRVWVCVEYARVSNVREVLRRWPNYWFNIPTPCKESVIKTYRKFVQEGTCHNLNKLRSGLRRTARTKENIELVKRSLI